MGYTVTERFQGRKPSDGDKPANEVPYLMVGDDPGVDDSEEDASAALKAEAPSTLGGLKLLTWKVDERLGPGFFLGTVTYGTGDGSGQRETGDTSYSFDTTGATVKITQSKNSVPWPVTAPSRHGVIGDDPDAPEGVEVTIPQFAFSITYYVADEDVTETYANTLYALTGKVNAALFRGLDHGECLFLGASGSKRGRGDWEITFKFAASPTVTDLAVGPVTGIAKLGWEYLWVHYEKQVIGTGGNKTPAAVPKHVYTEKVYDEADFGLLGLP